MAVTVPEKDIVILGPMLRLTAQPFDAMFLGGPVYRLAAGTTLSRDDVRAVDAWAEETGAVLVVARVAPADIARGRRSHRHRDGKPDTRPVRRTRNGIYLKHSQKG